MPVDAPPEESNSEATPSHTPLPSSALVPVAPRHDGWTPARQRAFIEALADSGSVTSAAAAVGMTAASAYRLRRRADARAFDAAWEAALERALQLLVPAALDRALNGTVRQRWYHGQMIAEERVFSDHLLLHLLKSGTRMLAHAQPRAVIRGDWSGAMDALEAGAAEPPPPPEPVYSVFMGYGGQFATDCPPPAGYAGPSLGRPGDPDYLRFLDLEEALAWAEKSATPDPVQEARRRRLFGLDDDPAPDPGGSRRCRAPARRRKPAPPGPAARDAAPEGAGAPPR